MSRVRLSASLLKILTLVGFLTAAAGPALAIDGPELYPGERQLEELALRDGLVVVGNLAPGWANWAAIERGFTQRYPGVTLAYNDIGSVAAVSALDRSRERPAIDVVYLFGLSAIDAQSRGLLAPFKPASFDRLPPALRDADGAWVAVHHLPIVFLVNRKLAKVQPRSWADLRKPEYKGAITYFDPITTSVGLLTAMAANAANGGSLESVRPAIDYFTQLHKAGNIQKVEPVAAFERFVRGEIPIWITFEQDGARLRQAAMSDDFEVIYPSEGTTSAVYTLSLVKNARNEAGAKLFLNYALSDPAQKLFADGFVRPALPGFAVGPESQRLPPTPRIDFTDLLRLSQRKPDLDRAWPKVVTGN